MASAPADHDDEMPDATPGGAIALTVPPDAAGERLDKWLTAAMAADHPDLSRNRLQALIRTGAVARNGQPADDPGAKLASGDRIVLDLPAPVAADPQPEPIPLSVAYEDDELIVIDKPAGLVVHPAAGHASGTLVNALLYHCGASLSGIGGVLRPGIVHRLDKETSGLLVIAKNDRAHRKLAAQFADHGRSGPLERRYLALVWGEAPLRQTIHTDIDRNPHDRERMAVVRDGKGREAITHMERLSVFPGADGKPLVSLIACMLETGRTHQIRVHMAHIGHPLLGDPVYGAGFKTKLVKLPERAKTALAALNRQALHAEWLGFEHPRTGETLHFESAAPADLQALIDALTSPDATHDSVKR